MSKEVHNETVKRLCSFVIIFFLVVIANPHGVYAHHRENVLGMAITNLAQLPPTIEGPGFLLPDSPFYFLDEVKQNIRIVFAFSPKAKAKLHADIAGERLAELRFMLARNNQEGIDKALGGFIKEYRNAARNLTLGQMSGENVSMAAKEINDGIKLKQQLLDVLEIASTGDTKIRVSATQGMLLSAKVEIEDSLSDADLANEVRYDIDRIAASEIGKTAEAQKAAQAFEKVKASK